MNIYSAKFMNEATASLSSKVFKNQEAETYLFSAMNILREMNTKIDEKSKQMYTQIAEAESKSDENKIFANYFFQFKEIFQNFSNKVNEMKSRMIISVENKVESWDDLLKDDSFISGFDGSFNYSGYEFLHMEESNYPRLNLSKIYQKEFDYIGQLMQDNNGIDASSTAKLKIIASVSNNFIKSSGDSDWIKCLVGEMIDIEENDTCKSYSECIYNSLRKRVDIDVNKTTLYTCKEKLTDYQDIVDAAVKLCDDLLNDLNKVAENISSYLFRNNDNKLKIKTNTDGIIDRDYRLDTYSMNQLDLFMNNKINQMKKVLNVYAIAIGIKFDTAIDYISQNIDILRTVKNCTLIDNEKTEDLDDTDLNSSDDMEDTSSMEDQDIDDEDNDEDDFEDDDHDDDEEDDHDENVSTDDMEELPEDDQSKEPISEEEPEDDTDFDLDTDYDDFEEAYLFEAELFDIELAQENANLYKFVSEAVLLEEDTNTATSNIQKMADKANAWQNILQKLANLWKKFKDVVMTNSGPRIEYLKKNGKFIENQITKEVKLKFTPNIGKLQSINIPDLNTELMKYLETEDDFISHSFNEFKPKTNEETFSQSIQNVILGKEQTGSANSLSISIKDAYDFCVNYQNNTNKLRAQTDSMEKAQRVAKDMTKVELGESANNNDFRQYFSEMEEVKDDNNQNNNNQTNNTEAKPNTDNSKKVTLYFKICSQVLAAEMTCYQKLFNELYAFCKWWIQTASGSTGNSNENKSANASNGDVKMN